MIKNCIYCGSELKENTSHEREGIVFLMCDNHLINVNFFSLPEDDYENVIQLKNNKYIVEIIEDREISVFNRVFDNIYIDWNHVADFRYIKNITPENFEDKIEKLLLFI
jgi:hypothetical protein